MLQVKWGANYTPPGADLPLRPAYSLLLLLGPTLVQAQTPDWSMCPMPPLPVAAPESTAEPDPDAPENRTRITADRSVLVREGVSEFEGEVVVEQRDRLLRAERLEYDNREQTARASGTLQYRDPQVTVESEGAAVSLDDDSGRFTGARFRLPDEHARGTAEKLLRTPDNRTILEGVQYTTCPPGENDWLLDAEHLLLDHDSGLGYGRGVLVRFMYVPLFYTPWISFPIDDRRRTGLLPPTLGTTALSGYEFALPFYWNIHPQADLTLTPRWMSKRGTQLQTEFRYLTGSGNGELYTEYLPDDRLYGADRYRYEWNHRSELPADFGLSIQANGVSDEQYFEDMGASLMAIAQASRQPRSLTLTQNGSWYHFHSQFLGYQILNPGTEPYFKLPAVNFDAEQYFLSGNLELDLESEIVNFQHDDRVSGLRADVFPQLRLRTGTQGWFLTPGLGYRHTQYALEQTDGSSLDLERSLPVYTLDSGLFLERDTGSGLLQTLEPRLFYLNVPYEAQGQIPRFDTSEPDFSFSRLFATNRFVGPDRQGDANRLSLALTSRLLDPATGEELLAGSLGRIRYFEPRRVQLAPATPAATGDWSGYIAELRFAPNEQWSLRSTVEWDPETRSAEQSSHQLQFRPGDYSVYNLGYRLRKGDFEQVDASFALPVTERLRLVGRWYYSLSDDKPLEYFGGFEYEDCCWIVRLVSRNYVYNRQGNTTDTLFLQLELKGLGAVGRRADEFLEDGILGYGPDDYDY